MAETIDREQLIRDMEWDLELFARVCLPHHTRLPYGASHKTVYRMLLQGKSKTCIVLPRGTGKTTLASLIFPLHQICYKKEHLIILVSETSDQAALLLEAIKDEIELNPRIRYFFGDLKNENKWTETEIETSTDIKVLAKGSGKRIRGTKYKQWRPGLILMDDFESEQNTDTPEQRDKLKRWVRGAVMPSLAQNGRIVFIGTIVHEDSFLNSIKDSHEYYVNPQEHWRIIDESWTKPLWPARWTIAQIKAIRDEYEEDGYLDMFYQEYMNIPMSPDSQIFKEEMIGRHSGYITFDANNRAYLKLPQEEAENEDYTVYEDECYVPVNIFSGIDPAMGKTRGDYTAIVTVAVTPSNHIYVVECLRKRIGPTDTLNEIFKLKEKYKDSLNRVKIETTAYQESLVQFLRQESLRRNVFVPITEVKPRNSKADRYADRNYGLEPRFRAHQIFLHENMGDMKQELITYPKGKHDDTIDALWSACYQAYPPVNTAPDWEEKKSSWNSHKNVLNWKCV